MKLWLIFVQIDESHTWLEAAWDDETTAENHQGWMAEVDRVEKMCAENDGYSFRVCETEVSGVFDLFNTPRLKATPAKAAE